MGAESDVVIVVAALSVLSLVGMFALVARRFRRVEPGTAMLVNNMNTTPRVLFDGGAIILPVVHKAETIDLSVKRIVLDRRGKEGLVCADCIRADVAATFFVRINHTVEDVLEVARSVGTSRAADPSTLEELFTAKFAEALKTVARKLDFDELSRNREEFKDNVIRVIGTDLNGYVLDDVAIDHLEQTPIEFLDPGNVLDAQGIKKIKTLTSAARKEQS